VPIIVEFLRERGLALNLDKTKIVSMAEGFDFLGFHFREYPDPSRVKGTKQGIFLVKPAMARIQAFREKVRSLVKSHRGKPMYVLVTKLNRLLRGWAEHYRTVTSKKVFTALGKYVWTLLWKMIRKKHPTMALRKLKLLYFKTVGGNNWVFFCLDSRGKEMTLVQLGWIDIKRHLICSSLNPFLPDNKEYFEKRVAKGARESVLMNKNASKLLGIQKGICPVCSGPLLLEEVLEVHHCLPRKAGGSDNLKNLLLLHKLCHKQVTNSKNHKLRAAWYSAGIIKSK
jgi:RNA-directed DNA polymerase